MAEANLPEAELNEQIALRRAKLAAAQSEGKNPYNTVKYDKTHYCNDIKSGFDSLEGQTVSLAGRMITRRIMGKASFCHVQDQSGTLQIYVKRDDVGEDAYAEFKKLDIGDIVGLTGYVFRTQMGEISVHAASLELLAKALLPLPEKYHGLKDTDLRYRQRYVDLIANPEVKRTFMLRSKIIKEIRGFLDAEGFIEVETPILNSIPGGASARPFVTHHNTLDIDLYMRIAPELYLKRLIVGGFEKVYEIGRLFRNEGMDTKHNPEFTTVELYEAYADYNKMADITRRMIAHIALACLGTTLIEYQGIQIDLSDWESMTMMDAVKKYTGIDFNETDVIALTKKMRAVGIEVKDNLPWGKLLYAAFDQKVEEHLIQPTFITDYPVEVSPLAKRKSGDPRLTERFEFFITAREMGNAFSELNDPIDQRERFKEQAKERESGDDEAQMTDEDFVNALEYGMPPTGGLGIGIDRLVMLLANQSSIRDVLLFPTMKPLK